MIEGTVKERIISFIASKNIGQTKFETICGLPRGYVTNMGKSPGADVLRKIKIAYPEISLDYLVLGEGDVNVTENVPQIENSSELLQEISSKDEEIAFLRSIISRLTAQPETPRVTNPSTDLGIKYYEEMMRELKAMKEELKKSI